MDRADGGVLVESGGFRIDAERALRKLRDFQAASDLLPEQLWIRAANAAGAASIRVDRSLREITIRFDGRPLPPSFLQDPFACLFDNDAGRFETHTARALLRELRERPEFVTVRSGGRRMRLTGVQRGQRTTAKDAPPPQGDWTDILLGPRKTVKDNAPPPGVWIRVRWPLWRSLRVKRAGSDALRPRMEWSRASLSIDGAPVAVDAPPPSHLGERRFCSGATRGQISARTGMPKAATRAPSVLYPSLDGVSVPIAKRLRALPASVETKVDSGLWRLNASLTKVVGDKNLADAVEMLAAQTRLFIRRQVKAQHQRAPRIGRMLTDGALERLRRNGHLLDPEEAYGISREMGILAVDLFRTLWLRDAAARAERGPRVFAGLLDRAPLFWSVRGKPLSVYALKRHNAGLVRCADKPNAAYPASDPVVWCALGKDDRRWLERLVGSTIKRVWKEM